MRFSPIGAIMRLIKTALKIKLSYLVGPEGAFYFHDENFSRRVPIFVHQATRVVVRLEETNAWVISSRRLSKLQRNAAEAITHNDDISRIVPGEFASGLLRIALEARNKDLVKLGGKHFMRTEADLDQPDMTDRYISFECLTKI